MDIVYINAVDVSCLAVRGLICIFKICSLICTLFRVALHVLCAVRILRHLGGTILYRSIIFLRWINQNTETELLTCVKQCIRKTRNQNPYMLPSSLLDAMNLSSALRRR
jgi:hypothetical protein